MTMASVEELMNLHGVLGMNLMDKEKALALVEKRLGETEPDADVRDQMATDLLERFYDSILYEASTRIPAAEVAKIQSMEPDRARFYIARYFDAIAQVGFAADFRTKYSGS